MAPDYEVYNHFLAKFHQQLDTFGPGRMAEELAELERVNTEITEQCDFVEKDNNNLGGVNKWWGPARLVGYLVMRHEPSTSLFVVNSQLARVQLRVHAEYS